MNHPLRVAVVVQRYGEDVIGGAESAARGVAEHLAPHVNVQVITTCARDYTTWENVYPPGEHQLNGVRLLRFPVDHARDWQAAQRETGRFLQRKRALDEELTWVRREGPFSTPLLNYIRRNEHTHDIFVFFTYLYATTCFGLPLVAHKAILAPTAHDEPFLYMEIYRRLCNLPQRLIYLTQAEQALVNQVTGNGHIPSDVIGVGINAPPDPSAERFRRKIGIHEPFILYGGRISAAKNVPELFDFFQRYRRENGRPVKLLLMGQTDIPVPAHADIRHLGVLSEEDKFDALAAAELVVLPSLYESLSIIILEAWLLGTPVLVNGRCEVTRRQCQQSKGGLYYGSYDEFAAILDRLLGDPGLAARLGGQGRRFVASTYNWDAIIGRYLANFVALAGSHL